MDSDTEDEKNLDKKFDRKKMAERQKMMDSLLKQVKHNKQLFLNNKLDELIHSFGDRRCRSACDLQTGWDLENDPQLRVTYPVSPTTRLEFFDAQITFKKTDSFANQPDTSHVLKAAIQKQKTRIAEQKEQ